MISHSPNRRPAWPVLALALAAALLAGPRPAQAGKLGWLDEVVQQAVREARAGGEVAVRGGDGASADPRARSCFVACPRSTRNWLSGSPVSSARRRCINAVNTGAVKAAMCGRAAVTRAAAPCTGGTRRRPLAIGTAPSATAG